MFPIGYNTFRYRRQSVDPRKTRRGGLTTRLLKLLDALATAGAKESKDPVPLFPPF